MAVCPGTHGTRQRKAKVCLHGLNWCPRRAPSAPTHFAHASDRCITVDANMERFWGLEPLLPHLCPLSVLEVGVCGVSSESPLKGLFVRGVGGGGGVAQGLGRGRGWGSGQSGRGGGSRNHIFWKIGCCLFFFFEFPTLKTGGGGPYFHTSKRKLPIFPKSAKTPHVGMF